jgi:hypothetical protein
LVAIDKLERLAAANMTLLPAVEITTHFVFVRDGYAALVERKGDGFGRIGSAGLLTERGLITLFWRGDRPFLVSKGFEEPATVQQVIELRAFQQDLEDALR